MFVECSSMNRYLQDLSHPSMTVVSRHRTNPASGEQRSVAVEGGKVKNYRGTYSSGFIKSIYGKIKKVLTLLSILLLITIYRLASLAVDCVTFPPYNKAGIVSCAHNITHTSVCTW